MPNEASHGTPIFSPEYQIRLLQFNFLDAAYKGGFEYRDALDPYGDPVLVPHESEVVGLHAADLQSASSVLVTQQTTHAGGRKYLRRKRIAAYENHVRPIVEKMAAYLHRDSPKRCEDEFAQESFDRVDLDQWIRFVSGEALKFGEYWIGFDAAPLPEGMAAEKMTVNDVAVFDPKHLGQPYIVACDPRRVIDWDENADGDIVRVVIEERLTTKGSFVSHPQTTITYKEWLPDKYRIWEQQEPSTKRGSDKQSGPQVRLVSEHMHSLGKVPWYRFQPPFPIQDIADLNRALYNVSSLLDEELFSCTFTEKYVTGAKPEAIQRAVQSSSNTLVIEDPEAKVGTLGAISGQAQSLMSRVEYLRGAIYMVVSMEGSTTKNVAETAEKKKRDMEALYTSLVKISNAIQTMENWLISSMGLVDTEADPDSLTVYGSKFDVNSLSDLIEEIKQFASMPFYSPSFVRSLMRAVVRKVEPFGDHKTYDVEIGESINAISDMVDQVVQMRQSNLLPAKLAAKLLGIPEESLVDFLAQYEQHPSGGLEGLLSRLDDQGEPDGDDPENAAEGDDADLSGDGEDDDERDE